MEPLLNALHDEIDSDKIQKNESNNGVVHFEFYVFNIQVIIFYVSDFLALTFNII